MYNAEIGYMNFKLNSGRPVTGVRVRGEPLDLLWFRSS